MGEITQFEKNGGTIIGTEAPPPLGMPGDNVLAWVVTAPSKHADVVESVPYRVANFTDAAKLDTLGTELGTGWHAATETLKRSAVAQYFIVVPEGATEADTINNIIGGTNPTTGQRTGIAAIADCAEAPTLIAAPGYSHNKPVLDALAAMGQRIGARVVADAPSTNTTEAIAASAALGGEGTGHDRVYLVDPQPAIYSKAAKADIYVPPSTMAMGAIAAVKPWESPDNQGVVINDTARPIEYDVLDGACEGNLLNRNGVSFFARSELGGWTLNGNRTVTGDFICHIGLADAIRRKLRVAVLRAKGKMLTRTMMEQEIRTIDLFVQDLVAAEIIPGGSVYLHPELNTVERYKNGSWYIVVDYGRYSPNEHMIIHLNSVDRIIEEFLEEVL